MSSNLVGVRFDPRVIEFLESLAKSRNVTRNDIIREVIFDKYENQMRNFMASGMVADCIKAFENSRNKPKVSSDPSRNIDVNELINSDEGRVELAIAMVEPIRRFFDFDVFSRNIVMVDELPQNCTSHYSRVGKVLVYKSNNLSDILDGSALEYVCDGLEEVMLPTHEICFNTDVRIGALKRDPAGRVNDAIWLAAVTLAIMEESELFLCLRTVLDDREDCLVEPDTVSSVLGLWADSEKEDCEYDKLVVNGETCEKYLRNANIKGLKLREEPFDSLSRDRLAGRFFDTDVMVVNSCPLNYVFLLPDSSKTGVMPIRQDLAVLPSDDTRRLRVGWVFYEEIGLMICADNVKGVIIEGNQDA
jgi:hypothetical protein